MQRINGAAPMGSRVLIRLQHGGDATLYADAAGTVLAANPLTVDASGAWAAYVRDGVYAVTTVPPYGGAVATQTLVLVTGGQEGRSMPSPLMLAQQHTQVVCPADTNENTLWSFTVPGGLMGPNDTLEIYGRGTQNNNANNKTLRVRAAGGTMLDLVIGTTSSANAVFASLSNRNSLTSQVGGRIGSSASSTQYCVTAAIDTRQPFVLSITGQLANAADALALESVVLKLNRAAS